jgi:hypothetical protein
LEKKVYEFKLPKEKKIEFGEYEITFSPYLTLSQQVVLIKKYIGNYFDLSNATIKELPYNYFDAQLMLKLNVIDLLTDIDVKSVDVDTLISIGLFDKIQDKIINYWEFESTLEEVIKLIRENIVNKNSINSSFVEVKNKIMDLLEKLSNINPDEIKQLAEKGTGLLKELENTPMVNILNEAQGQPVKNKKKEEGI